MQFFFDKDGDGTISFAEFCRFVGVDVSNEKYAKDIETDDAKLAAARDEVDRNSGPVRKMRRSLLDKTRNSLTRRRAFSGFWMWAANVVKAVSEEEAGLQNYF